MKRALRMVLMRDPRRAEHCEKAVAGRSTTQPP
jgi:hypothetical protein